MRIAYYTDVINGHRYSFGMLALRRFNERMNCEPSFLSVYATFEGCTLVGALIETIRAGYEQASGENITEYQAATLAENMDPEERQRAVSLFLSSLVGEPYENVVARILADPEAELAKYEAVRATTPQSLNQQWLAIIDEAGSMGLTPDQLYHSFAWCQYQNYRTGYQRARQEERRRRRENWQRALASLPLSVN